MAAWQHRIDRMEERFRAVWPRRHETPLHAAALRATLQRLHSAHAAAAARHGLSYWNWWVKRQCRTP